MKQTKFWSRKLYRRAVQLFCSFFYVNPGWELNRSILVAGAARSGTTWLGDLIAYQIPCRIMFEPFNPDLVPGYRPFNYFQYLRPGEQNAAFYDFARKVFTGEIRNRWIDRQNERIFSQYRLIKEIRANLCLKWLHESFPEVPILFLVRHPCAVVFSRMQLGWATDRDISPFLLQTDLIADHLSDYIDLIKGARTDEEKHAIIWSVSNLVPLRQFNPGELRVVYYENLYTQPETEMAVVFDAVRQKFDPSLMQKMSRPSQTARASSAVVTGTNQLTHWQNKLSSSQIENILRVVKAFGLDHLYGDATRPLNSQAGGYG